MSGNITTAQKQSTGIRVDASLLMSSEGQVKNLSQRRDLSPVPGGTVTLWGRKVAAFTRSYEASGVTRQELHLAISREGVEQILKADIAVRAKELVAREDNPAIGYYASSDKNAILEAYRALWTSMNQIRTTWYADIRQRPRWDNRSTHGLEIVLPEFGEAKYYILADRSRNELVLLRRLSGEEYDAKAAMRAAELPVASEAVTIDMPDF